MERRFSLYNDHLFLLKTDENYRKTFPNLAIQPQGVKYIVEEGIKSKLKPLRGVSYVAVVVMLVCLVILLTVLLVTKDVTADEAAGKNCRSHKAKSGLRDFRPGPTQTALYILQKMDRGLTFRI